MRTSPPTLLPLFRSEAQARMLARLLLHPEDALTFQQLRHDSQMSTASLHRELERAEAAGVVTRDRSRRPHVFRADRDSPTFEHLAALLRSTVGAEAEIERALAAVHGIDAAAVHGSWADGSADARSDIDLLVVGTVDRRALKNRLRRLEREIGREIDVTVLELDELRELAQARNAFVHSVINRPRFDVVGDFERALST